MIAILQALLFCVGLFILITTGIWVSISSHQELTRMWVKLGYIEIDGKKFDLEPRN